MGKAEGEVPPVLHAVEVGPYPSTLFSSVLSKKETRKIIPFKIDFPQIKYL